MTDKRVPTAWIATGPNGRVLHFAVEDGWTVDAVMHEPLPPLDPQPSAPVAGEDAKLIGACMKLETDEEAYALHRYAKCHGISDEAAFDIASWGYCMGLERAAKVAEQHFIYGHAVAGPGFAAVCATKIRALGDGE